ATYFCAKGGDYA
nr:immunoglobulin heavy chain junction region [Mus musculus]